MGEGGNILKKESSVEDQKKFQYRRGSCFLEGGSCALKGSTKCTKALIRIRIILKNPRTKKESFLL